MIDFVKIYYYDAFFILDNKYLEFEPFKRSSQKAEYQGLKFILHESGLLIVNGSLHKYKNLGLHNYDFFSYPELLEVVEDIKDKFKLKPARCNLKQFEYGINIQPPITCLKLLGSNKTLLRAKMHKNRPFILCHYPTKYYQVGREAYIVKLYDKGRQFKQAGREILRYEIKYKPKGYPNRSIKYLADILNIDVLKVIGNDVLKKWEKVILFSPPIRRVKELFVRDKVSKWNEQQYWIELAEEDRRKFSRECSYFRKFLKVYTENHHSIIKELLIQECDKFQQITKSKYPILSAQFGINFKECIIQEVRQIPTSCLGGKSRIGVL